MNFIVNGDMYNDSTKEYSKVIMKEMYFSKKGVRLLVLYLLAALFMVLNIIINEEKKLFIVCLIVVLLLPFLAFLFALIANAINSNKKVINNIDKVEHIFGEDYNINVYFKEGSSSNAKYKYENIMKIVESKDNFFVFLNDSVAIPIAKKAVDDIEKFKNFVKDKNIRLKEAKQ